MMRAFGEPGQSALVSDPRAAWFGRKTLRYDGVVMDKQWHTQGKILVTLLPWLAACRVGPGAVPAGGPPGSAAAGRVEVRCSEWVTHVTRGVACIHALTEEQSRHRERFTVLLVEGDRVLRSRLMSGAGREIGNDEGVSSWEYRYQGKNLVEQIGRDPRGALKTRLIADGRPGGFRRVDAWGRPKKMGDSTRIWRQFDERGLIASSRYFDEQWQPVSDEEGAHEYRYRRDARGFLISSASFDAAGKPATRKAGYHQLVYVHDASTGEMMEMAVFGPKGEPALDGLGAHRSRFRRDAAGNPTECAFFGADGKPARTRLEGAMWRATFDERGNRVEVSWFDEAGQPGQGRQGCSRMRYSFDGRGYGVGFHCFDEASRPTNRNDGVHGLLNRIDERGFVAESRFADTSGQPTTNAEGCHAVRFRRDDRGLLTEITCLDGAGAPRKDRRGIAVSRYSHDAREQLVEVSYHDAEGHPVRQTRGYAVIRRSYSEGGEIVRNEYLDEQGNGVELFGGWALRLAHGGATRAPRGVRRGREEALALAEQLRQQGGTPAEFERLTKLYSDGDPEAGEDGWLGWFARGFLSPELESVFFMLPAGVTSKPVETPAGVYLLHRKK